MLRPSDVTGGASSDLSLWISILFQPPRRSRGRGAVGVAQHWVEGARKVVGQRAAVVLLRQGHQAGQDQQHQEEQVEGEGGPQDPVEEGSIPPLLPGPGQRRLMLVGTGRCRRTFTSSRQLDFL